MKIENFDEKNYFIINYSSYIFNISTISLFPLIIFYLVQTLEREHEFIGFIVAYNWASVIQNSVYLPFAILFEIGAIGGSSAEFVNLILLCLVLTYTWFVCKTTLQFVGSLFKGKGDTSQLGGPIKIAKITGQVAEYGIIPFFSIMAYISISLGLINLFPIPMLDGGHLMFYFIERILGRPLSQKTQEGFFRIGLFLLVSLMFFVTINDLKDIGLF